MIAKIINWSIKNRILVLLCAVVIVAYGLFSLQKTAIDAIPDLSDVQVIIKTTYPGQSPQVVEDQVTYPLTTAMLSVPGAKVVRGYSFLGDSYVYIIFEDGTDMYWARSRVLEYLSQVTTSLPAQAKSALGPDATGVGWIFSYALVDKTGKHDLSELRSLQDWYLKYELQTVPGVSEVASVGGMVKQYQVRVDPNKLRAYNLSLIQVKQAIKNGNQESGASVLELGEGEYMLRISGYVSSLDDLKLIPLKMNVKGTPLLLRDVADIRLGPQMRRGITELNGEGEVVSGIIVMRFGENAQGVIQALKAKLKELQKGLPKGVEIVPTYDRSELINAAVDNLYYKLLEEFIVVILVCAAFLFHFRSALVVLVSLPIGIFCAFIIMSWQGISANIMSLGGIAIAIGAMVDGAIVMIENVHKHIEKTPLTDENRWQVISKAAIEVGPALFFSLLIITFSFLPVFALEGQSGKMFSPLAFTKTYAMAASAGLAITLIPVLMGYFIRGKVLPEHKNPLNRGVVALYKPVLTFSLKYPKSIIIFAFLLLMVGFYPLNKIGSEFIPPLDEGDLMYMPSTYPGISIGKARQLLQQTNKLIKTVPEVKTVWGKIGRADTATDPAPLTMIETVIQFNPQSTWRPGMTKDKLKKEFDALIQFPGVRNAWVMPIKTRIDMLATGIKTPLGVKISGSNLAEIEKIGKQLERILTKVPGTSSVYAERVSAGRYIKVDIDRTKAARYGLNIAEIQELIGIAIGGQNVGQSVEGLERYPINLRYINAYRDSLSALRNLPIVTQKNITVSLQDIAKVYVQSGPAMIKTENARLNGWVFVDIENRDLGSYVQDAKARVDKELSLPAGYTLIWSGQYEYMQKANARLAKVIPVTVIIIILLLYMAFRRVGEVLLILATLPFALMGGIWLMFLLNFNFSIAVGVGFIALAGVSIEIGVIMLLYLNQSLEAKKLQRMDKFNVQDLRDAVMQGAGLRVRPVMMTVATVVMGLVPIMFAQGAGSEVMQRIAAPMIGGMLSAITLTLLILPSVYFQWKKRAIIKANKKMINK
ncbi:CzcA family heavy metal efflux pump [Psychromonas sp. CNPT3]|uniref:efflux RND transporter permease subunit n=1 Tax=Psychromonas sp. CNPT3 TaxID=314282 RepID=UPI00006E9160|nr:efflux RND transporter permease subunit [Psychromonas sp. CNPT3]AGH81837.1 CzcA family heavy metal efflux pump [Psychromonas sp. CNPT3]